MAKSLSQIEQQIAKLQHRAKLLKAKEAVGVIARIRGAIEHYGLTPQDLFGPVTMAKKKAVKSLARALPGAEKLAPSATKRASKKLRGKAAPKKTVSPPKYEDGAGRTWTGNGQRPGWFKAAIASGKAPEDLLIKAKG